MLSKVSFLNASWHTVSKAVNLGSNEVSGVAWSHEQSVLSTQLLGKSKVTNAQ